VNPLDLPPIETPLDPEVVEACAYFGPSDVDVDHKAFAVAARSRALHSARQLACLLGRRVTLTAYGVAVATVAPWPTNQAPGRERPAYRYLTCEEYETATRALAVGWGMRDAHMHAHGARFAAVLARRFTEPHAPDWTR
jgi:hypothetical protein